MSDVGLSRRSLLLAVAATAAGLSTGLAGCDAGPDEPATPAETSIEALTPVLVGQRQLLAAYAQTLSAFPELTPTLSDLQAQSSAHTEALFEAAPAAAAQVEDTPESSAPTATSSASSAAPPQPVPTPADAPTALAALAQAVGRALDTLTNAALSAEGDLAALLGSCAASTACHVRLLA